MHGFLLLFFFLLSPSHCFPDLFLQRAIHTWPWGCVYGKEVPRLLFFFFPFLAWDFGNSLMDEEIVAGAWEDLSSGHEDGWMMVFSSSSSSSLRIWRFGRGGAGPSRQREEYSRQGQIGNHGNHFGVLWFLRREMCVWCVLCGGGFDLGLAALSTGARLPCGTEAQQCLRFGIFGHELTE